ncbi:uncharacterized protein GGS22DRAFT_169827 [Annulohypoxylon maeteangense]|uniref:uncharacterized protein n=1 Tax=Annulohypoxylon maeteangense TaxID=1927788 RepID=UPI002007A31C|nr:uncharacterized protein GGS22DRAFT_169827 [Annulohypoxylon maeteangense]KAI0882600.1 hypothetical protein GGS22DRAFT_169827 [Annulohypoxylon maeteangense]
MSTPMQLDLPLRQASKMTGNKRSNGDVGMTSTSTIAPSTEDFARDLITERDDSSMAISSDLKNLRISSSRERPLFPRYTKDLEMSSASNTHVSNPSDVGGSKRKYTWNSMAEMISAHVEELKERPPLGTPKEDAKQIGKSGGGSQQISNSKGKEKAKGAFI